MLLRSKPILCNYYVTYRCNASCHFCDIWEKPSPYVTLANAEENFIALKKNGVRFIDFTGGEPLLHREIDKLLLLAKKYGFVTTLTTNTLLYPKWADKLKGLVDMLHFSLDSASKEIHDKGRGVACYDALMNAIAVAKAIGEKPDILFTVFNHNIDDIDEIYQKIILPNKLVLILNPVFNYNDVASNDVLSNASLKKLSNWYNKKYIFLNKALIKLRVNGGNKIDRPVCKAVTSTVVISPNNELILPCYHLGIKSIPIENNLTDLLKSDTVERLKKMEGRFEQCNGCTINCYMQPSFSVNFNQYFLYSLPSTLKYNYYKRTWISYFFNTFVKIKKGTN